MWGQVSSPGKVMPTKRAISPAPLVCQAKRMVDPICLLVRRVSYIAVEICLEVSLDVIFQVPKPYGIVRGARQERSGGQAIPVVFEGRVNLR